MEDYSGEPSSKKPKQEEADNKIAVCKPFIQRLLGDDLTQSERTLGNLQTASFQLKAYMFKDMAMNDPLIDPKLEADCIWTSAMQDFRFTIGPALAFAQQLPGFSVLPPADRCVLFSRALIPLIVAEMSLPTNSLIRPFFGMNDFNRSVFLQKFPKFRDFSAKIDQLVKAVQLWQPNDAELGLLAAFIFYQEEMSNYLKHPTLVLNIRARLKLVLQTLMARNGCSNRLRHFMHVYDLLRVIDLSYMEGAVHLVNDRTAIRQDPLYLEMYAAHADPVRMNCGFSNSPNSQRGFGNLSRILARNVLMKH